MNLPYTETIILALCLFMLIFPLVCVMWRAFEIAAKWKRKSEDDDKR